MIKKVKISDFSFIPSGYGAYIVTYNSPVSSKKWSKRITDMTIIDATKNSDFPKLKDLNRLRQIVKL